jgi:Flp pilus assembly protein TadG
MSVRPSPPLVSSPRNQRGATALEFGLIFPALFVLFYGTLTFALIFTARMGLQHAAEEGARSAVTFRVAADADPVDITQLTLRRNAARDAALAQAGWISRWAPLQVQTRICAANSDCAVETTDCGRDLASACKIFVTVTYPYATRPILPRVPGFGWSLPDQLQGQASLLLDGRMLSS